MSEPTNEEVSKAEFELRRFQRHTLLRTFAEDGHLAKSVLPLSNAIDTILAASRLRSPREGLREAADRIFKYAGHDSQCIDDEGDVCICGFSTAAATLRAALASTPVLRSCSASGTVGEGDAARSLVSPDTDLVVALREGAKTFHAWFVDGVEPSFDCAIPAYLNEAANLIQRARCDHQWSSPERGAPECRCIHCGQPKVEFANVFPAPAPSSGVERGEGSCASVTSATPQEGRPASVEPSAAWREVDDDTPRDRELMMICADAYEPTPYSSWWGWQGKDGWFSFSRPEEKWHGGVNRWLPTHWFVGPLPSSEAPPVSDGLGPRSETLPEPEPLPPSDLGDQAGMRPALMNRLAAFASRYLDGSYVDARANWVQDEADAILSLLPAREGWKPLADGGWKPGEQVLIWRPSTFTEDRVFRAVLEGDTWVVHDGKFDHHLRGEYPTHWLPISALGEPAPVSKP